MTKLARLRDILREMHSVAVAYSGGTDSTFLIKVASLVLKGKVLAVTAVSPTYPVEELRSAVRMARRLKVRHLVIATAELRQRRFIENSPQRCYFCKKELFRRLRLLATKYHCKTLCDASTCSDQGDYRPGERAKKENGVRSPLVEAGFTKKEIRSCSKRLGLSTWDKPAQACLASRIPYHTRISRRLLGTIESAESYLRRIGLQQVRVRHGDGHCRIEVPGGAIPLILARRSAVVQRMKALGYTYITLDLEGYRTGSGNEILSSRVRSGPVGVRQHHFRNRWRNGRRT